MRKPVVAGNWKMNGRRETIESLVASLVGGAEKLNKAEVLVCPPSIYLDLVASKISGQSMGLGAQNTSQFKDGAYTGELSVGMLSDIGCQYVIIGHSERRAIFGESDEQVAEKVKAVLEAGITPILCVGETKEEREKNQTIEVVSGQLGVVMERVGVAEFEKLIVAYEPVWAIGTGLTASPEQAQEVHAALRKQVVSVDATVGEKLRILYGGSVNAANASELFGQQDIDGGLIGGASLKAADFLAICEAACSSV